MVSSLSNAVCGLIFGQLLRGDAEEARKTLKKILRSSSRPNRKKVELKAAPAIRHPRRLKLAPVKLDGTQVETLFDTAAVPNIISISLVKELNLEYKKTNRAILTASGTRSKCVRVISRVLVKMDTITKKLQFLFVENPPYRLIIGDPTMTSLRAVTDHGKMMIRMFHGGREAELPLRIEEATVPDFSSETPSEDFTSNDETDFSSLESDTESYDNGGKESMVVRLLRREDDNDTPMPCLTIGMEGGDNESDGETETEDSDESDELDAFQIHREEMGMPDAQEDWKRDLGCFQYPRSVHLNSNCVGNSESSEFPNKLCGEALDEDSDEYDSDDGSDPSDDSSNDSSDYSSEDSSEGSDDESDNDSVQSLAHESDNSEDDSDVDSTSDITMGQTPLFKHDPSMSWSDKRDQWDHAAELFEGTTPETVATITLAEPGSRDESVPTQTRDPGDDEPTREELMEKKLKHLEIFPRRAIKKMLTESDVIADTLHDLRPSSVPFKHSFILKDEKPVFHRPRKMSQRDQEITEKEVKRMLDAGIIKP